MFPDISINYIFGPALLLVIIFGAIYKGYAKPFNNEFEQSIFNLKITVIQIGILLAVLWLSLPPTPPLSTGYPEDINSIDTNGKILHYLQQYNHAIVRTTEVLHWTLFLVAWWLLSSIFTVIKAYNKYTARK